MVGLVLRQGVMEQILLRESRYAEGAYLFVLASLEYKQTQLNPRRHVTAPELACACRDLAIKQFGVMSRLVLEQWGIRSTDDIGAVVFTLAELGYLSSLPTDTRDQFADVYDFMDAFDRKYPWTSAALA